VLLDWTDWAKGVNVNGGSPIIDYRVSYSVLTPSRRRLSEY